MYNCYTSWRKLKCAGGYKSIQNKFKKFKKKAKNRQTPNPWILQKELKEGHTGIIIFEYNFVLPSGLKCAYSLTQHCHF